jgi:hypothetical protein
MKNNEMGETYRKHGAEQKCIEGCPEKIIKGSG